MEINNTFTYNLSDTEYLVFKTQRDDFELYSGHDGTSVNTKIATYKNNKWNFEDYHQQKLFWFLFNIYKNDFGKAFRQYTRSLNEKPKTYVIECAARRFNIKVTKLKRNITNKFFNLYPTR
jgi:hypothetical protein